MVLYTHFNVIITITYNYLYSPDIEQATSFPESVVGRSRDGQQRPS